MADLYLWKMGNDELLQLTDDKFADLQPQWSPDGNTIAFITDRGDDSSLDDLRFGKLKVALYIIRDKKIELLPELPFSSKHINPIFDTDGRGIYLIADPDGLSNIYHYQFSDKKFYRVTYFNFGVSGITSLSPAFSFSKTNNTLLFSVFNNSGYDIYKLKPDSLLEPGKSKVLSLNILPPLERKDNEVYTYLTTSTLVKQENKFPEVKYVPKLELDLIGGLSIGAWGNQYGTYAAAGGLLRFSAYLNDMLFIRSYKLVPVLPVLQEKYCI
jgi:hypothetical protein